MKEERKKVHLDSAQKFNLSPMTRCGAIGKAHKTTEQTALVTCPQCEKLVK